MSTTKKNECTRQDVDTNLPDPMPLRCWLCDEETDIKCYNYCQERACCIHYCKDHLPNSQPYCEYH